MFTVPKFLNSVTLPFRSLLASLLLIASAWPVAAIVTPAPHLAFSTNSAGQNILAQMQQEATNPALATVVYLGNSNPNAEFGTWTGTLISSNWILTCAHTLQGTNGRGGGIVLTDLSWYSSGIPYSDPVNGDQIAEFIVHTNWQRNAYSNGYDIALMRLAVPVTNALVYPRLSATDFQAPLPVVLAGFGKQGDGITGETGNTGTFAVGINTLDAVGGEVTTNGNGQANFEFIARNPNIALLDFDKSRHLEFNCGGGAPTVLQTVGESTNSVMGRENELTEPVLDPCHLTNRVAGVFETDFCDFMGGVGDSGGPVFGWPHPPLPPAAGFYLSNRLELVGLASSVIYNNAAARSRYGDVGTYTLVKPYLGFIYEHVRDLAESDSDGDGQNDELENRYGSNPYDASSTSVMPVASDLQWLFKSDAVAAYELALIHVQVQSVTEISPGVSEVRFTASVTNRGEITYGQPQADLPATLPAGLGRPTNAVDLMLRFPDAAPGSTVAAMNSAAVQVQAPAGTAADVFLASAGSIRWSLLGYESIALGANVIILDSAFANSRIRLDGYTYWFSNPPPALTQVGNGWLVLQGTNLPAQVCCAPAAVEVSSVLTNAAGEIGLVTSTSSTLDWLKWVKSGSFKAKGGYGDSTIPRNSRSPGTAIPPMILTETDSDGNPVSIHPASPPQASLLNGFQVDPQVTVSGSMGLGKLTHNVDIRVRNFKVSYLNLSLVGHPYWTVGLRAENTVTFPRREADLVDVYFPPDTSPGFINPFKLSAGPFALEVQLHARLYLGAEGSVSAASEMTVSQEAEFTASFVINEGQSSFEHQFIPQPLDVTNPLLNLELDAQAKVFAGAELGVRGALKLSGVTVATGEGAAFLEPYARLDVRPLEGPAWDVYGGVSGGAHITADALFWNVVDQQFPTQFVEEARLFGSPAPSPVVAKSASLSAPEHVAGAEARWSKIWPTLQKPQLSSSDPAPFAMALKENGNVAIGYHASNGFWLAELDRHGNSLWQKLYTRSAIVFGGLARVPGDGYVIVSAGAAPTLIRVDDAGNVRWITRYNLSPVGGSRIQVDTFRDSSGQVGIIIAGGSGSDAIAIRVDDTGHVLWARRYGTDGNTFATKVRATTDGGFLLACRSDADLPLCADTSSPSCWSYVHNVAVLKLTAAGDVQWATLCKGNILNDVTETPEGGALAVGATYPIVVAPYNGPSAHKFDANGSLLWQTTYAVDLVRTGDSGPLGDNTLDEARAITRTADGYLIAGYTGYLDNTGAWLLRIKESGEPLWYSLWNGPKADQISQVLDRGDCFLALGVSASFEALGVGGTNRLWLSALPHSGQLKFQPAALFSTDYRHPQVQGFADATHPDPWLPIIPTVQPLTVTTSTVSVVTVDYWAPTIELAQSHDDLFGSQPQLNITPAQTNSVLLSWPVLGSAGFVPQSANALTGLWTNMTNLVLRSGDHWSLQTQATNSQQFFRLAK